MNPNQFPNYTTSGPGCAESEMIFGYIDELGNLKEEVTRFKSCRDEEGFITSEPIGETITRDAERKKEDSEINSE